MKKQLTEHLVKREFIECNCASKDHLIVAEHIVWDESDQDLILWAQLGAEESFFKRLWQGIKYIIFGYKKAYLWADCTLLDKAEAIKLKSVVESYLRHNT